MSRIIQSCSIPHAGTSPQSWNLVGFPAASVDAATQNRILTILRKSEK